MCLSDALKNVFLNVCRNFLNATHFIEFPMESLRVFNMPTRQKKQKTAAQAIHQKQK